MNCPIIHLTSKLIKCRSISPKDDGCQKILIKKLKKNNFITESIFSVDTNNLWAYHGKNNCKTLVFLGHTDVVPIGDITEWYTDPFSPIIKNGYLYGRGSVDMKGSLAAMLIAAERFVLNYPNHKGRLAFIITSDEESTAKNGTVKVIEKLMTRGEIIDYCLIGEPSSKTIICDTIKHGRRGSITADIIIKGIQGHVAYPYFADNPIHKSIPFLNDLISTILDTGNKYFEPSNIQIISITSGNKNINNMIPHQLSLKLNIRFNTELTVSKIYSIIENLLTKYLLNYKISWHIFAKPFITEKGNFTKIVINSIKDIINITPQLNTTGGTSDGRFLICTNAQIVELGPINKTIHQANECINIKELQLLSKVYENIIIKTLINQ